MQFVSHYIDTTSADSYRLFLQAKRLPVYNFRGRSLEVPSEYAHLLGLTSTGEAFAPYAPPDWAFDYQREITAMAIDKRKFAGFIDCGFGKTLIELEFARYALENLPLNKRVLIITPLMVVPQFIDEAAKFYNDSLPIEQIPAAKLQAWLNGEYGERLGITNWDALRDGLTQGQLGALILDESSMLKHSYGKTGLRAIELGKGLAFKFAGTGTPAPNDRIEYANHAVFLDVHRSVNEFLARYFVNRGQTQGRWELKPHALKPFYRDLSHWSIFLSDPSVYGWKDNTQTIPPIHTHIHEVEMTPEQMAAVREVTGSLIASTPGGIGQRGKLAQIAKGFYNKKRIPTLKPAFIRELCDSWSDSESTIVWCRYNDEQAQLEEMFSSDAVSITGDTPYEKRLEYIQAFKRKQIANLITKPSILGFGLNLQVATRQVFSTCHDSYEEHYQAIKRSNRVGSIHPLHAHIPVCDVEMPMVQTVLEKADRVESDTREQELLFREMMHCTT